MHFVSAIFIFIQVTINTTPMNILVEKEIEVEEPEPTTILADVFGGSPEVRLLDFFMDHPLNDYMQKEIAENTGMNKRTIGRALGSLTSNRILKVTRTIGKARLYRLDSENPVVQDIRSIERRLSLAAANEEG